MSKKLYFLLSLVLALVTTLSLTNPVSATSEIESNLFNNMTDEQKAYYKKLKEYGGEINILNKEQEKEIHNAIKVNNTTKNFHNKQLKGFEEIIFNSKMTSYEITD